MRRPVGSRILAAIMLAGMLLAPAAALAEPPTQGAPAAILILLGALRKASALRGDREAYAATRSEGESAASRPNVAQAVPDFLKPGAVDQGRKAR